MSADPADVERVLALARLFGLDDADRDDLTALAAELVELLGEGKTQALDDLGDLPPAVGFEPTG